MYRHSFFVETQEQADKVEKFLKENYGQDVEEDALQSYDEDSQNFEVRFLTEDKLPEWEISFLLLSLRRLSPILTYACNCEDW